MALADLTPPPRPLYAIGSVLVATAFFAVTTLIAKAIGTGVLGAPLHPMQVSHGRFFFAFVSIITMAALLRPKLTQPNLPMHLGRSLFGWGGVTLMFAAAAQIPLSDATAISFLNPVFAMLLAIPLLGERVGPWRWAAAGIALVGALVLLRSGPDSFQLAALLALGAALMMGAEMIFIKRLTRREAPFQILIFNNAIGLTIATLAVLWVWVPPTPQQWLALATIGCVMAAGQVCFLQAMRSADASFVLPFSYATLIWATLFDGAVFGVIPDAVSVAGASIILAGAGLLAWREAVRRR